MAISLRKTKVDFQKVKVVFLTFFCLAAACSCFYASFEAQARGLGFLHFACLQALMFVNFVNAWTNLIRWTEYK